MSDSVSPSTGPSFPKPSSSRSSGSATGATVHQPCTKHPGRCPASYFPTSPSTWTSYSDAERLLSRDRFGVVDHAARFVLIDVADQDARSLREGESGLVGTATTVRRHRRLYSVRHEQSHDRVRLAPTAAKDADKVVRQPSEALHLGKRFARLAALASEPRYPAHRLPHHLAHLIELLKQCGNVLRPRARSVGDAFAA